MPEGMARIAPALIAALAALAATLLLSIAASGAAPAPAEAASASSCGVDLEPASRNVRRGGKVLLQGDSCSAGSSSSGGGSVQVKIQKNKRWATVAKGQTDSNGDFTVCAKVNVPRGAKVARLRATTPGGTGSTTVRVGKKGPSGCRGLYKPPPPEVGNPNCPLYQNESDIEFTLPSACTVLGSDTASNPDPIPFYGHMDCANASRHQQITSGGDPSAMTVGGSQGDSAYRRLTVIDGDDYWGERCELGINDKYGPMAFYHEGQRRVTYASFRLNNSFPLNSENWQGVMQIKQAQTSDNGGGTPVLSLSAFDAHWSLWHSGAGYTSEDFKLWEAPASKNQWTRIAIDAKFSQHASVGWVKMYVDLNADGDFDDGDEQSPRFHTNTLKYETGTDNSDGISAGQSIPSHLRVGMYHDSVIPCPAPTGCAVEADNVQVVKP